MNLQETGLLLADVARRDRRQPSEAMLAMWHDALRDIAYVDAKAALRLLNRESTDYLMPAHVRQAVKRVHAELARPSLATEQAKAAAIADCEYCDERGYRLPRRLAVCTHRAPAAAVGWAARMRRAIGSAS